MRPSLDGSGAELDASLPVTELAPAKINLALHVTGQRLDGYHLIESIVTFADIGDHLTFSPADEDRLSLSGPFAPAITGGSDNLVARARDGLRRLLQARGVEPPAVAIHLEKNLPVASGIGGGSADAAATLRGLLRLWSAGGVGTGEIEALALSIGADVPMCLTGRPLIASGIGEKLSPLPDMPRFALVLGNPLRGVSTPEVFSRLASRQNPRLVLNDPPDWMSSLAAARNDLQGPASDLVPEIGELCDLLRSQGAVLTRMSGSGATCFGIFDSRPSADHAVGMLQAAMPDWYFASTETIAGS